MPIIEKNKHLKSMTLACILKQTKNLEKEEHIKCKVSGRKEMIKNREELHERRQKKTENKGKQKLFFTSI